MKGQKKTKHREERWNKFEEIYIYTYPEICRYVQYITTDEEKIKQLLVLTYSEFYFLAEKSMEPDNAVDWLKKKADFFAKTRMNITSRQVLTASFREKEIDEASIFFEIKDYLHIDEEKNTKNESPMLLTILKIFASVVFLVLAAGVLIFGSEKLDQQLQILREPFLKSLTFSKLRDSQNNKENYVVVNHKRVYLSEIGQVLYSIPLDEKEEFLENPEIQIHGSWVYYLPCPEREDSLLSEVSPSLSHILYRVKDEKEIEIVAREVDDYCLWNEHICVARFGSFQTIDGNEDFEKIDPGVYISLKDNKFYLKDLLGRSLEKDENSCIHYEDRYFVMDGDTILDVIQAEEVKDGIAYRLDSIDEEYRGIYRNINGIDELYLGEEMHIDSFCIVDNWLYYSACIRGGDSSSHYSRIFRKSLVNEEKAEKVGKEFSGRVFQMYFCKENQHIYADYTPEKEKINHGVIAVISLNGQMSYLDDQELRSGRETSGNDTLEFVMVQDNQVYCYWQDKAPDDEGGEVLWRDTLIIPNGDRIYMN